MDTRDITRDTTCGSILKAGCCGRYPSPRRKIHTSRFPAAKSESFLCVVQHPTSTATNATTRSQWLLRLPPRAPALRMSFLPSLDHVERGRLPRGFTRVLQIRRGPLARSLSLVSGGQQSNQADFPSASPSFLWASCLQTERCRTGC